MTYEELLKHAEECERLATLATLPSNRIALLSSAEMRRMLASKANVQGVPLNSPLSEANRGKHDGGRNDASS